MKTWVYACLLLLAGCSDMGTAFSGEAFPPPFDPGSDAGGGNGGGGSDNGGGEEVEAFRLSKPASTGNYVFIANETTGTVARVSLDGGAIRISTARVGARPTQVLAIPGRDAAAVLNLGSSSLSLVRAGVGGAQDEVETVPLVSGANRIALSPDGAWAAGFYDARLEAPRVGALSEMTLVRLTDGDLRTVQLSVGLNIREAAFTSDGQTLLVVTDEGVSRVAVAELTEDRFVPPVPISDPLTPLPLGGRQEVLLTGDGTRAVVRASGDAAVTVVDLDSGERLRWDLPVAPTDIDLLSDGRIIASLREGSGVSIAEIDEVQDGSGFPFDEVDVAEHPVGQTAVAEETDTAVLFAADAESDVGVSLVSVLDLSALTYTVLNVRKGVIEAVLSPDGRYAVLLHSKVNGSAVPGASETEILQRLYAVSVVVLETGAVKLIPVPHFADDVQFSSDGKWAWVLVADAGSRTYEIERIDLATFRVDTIRFQRLPLSMGFVENAGVLYVAQEHELGRIAFVDQQTLQVREVTGFELNGLTE